MDSYCLVPAGNLMLFWSSPVWFAESRLLPRGWLHRQAVYERSSGHTLRMRKYLRFSSVWPYFSICKLCPEKMKRENKGKTPLASRLPHGICSRNQSNTKPYNSHFIGGKWNDKADDQQSERKELQVRKDKGLWGEDQRRQSRCSRTEDGWCQRGFLDSLGTKQAQDFHFT